MSKAMDTESWATSISDTAEIENLNTDDKNRYLSDMMTERDWNSCLESRHDEGLAQGRAEGIALGRSEGLVDGIAIGEARGEARGKAEQSREIAKAMKAQKLSVETIMACTGLSQEVIIAL